MATKTFYGTNTLLGSTPKWQELSETSPGATATSSPNVGWTLAKIEPTRYSELSAGEERAAATFSTTAVPDGTIANGGGTNNTFRTATPLTGRFEAGKWACHFVVRAVTAEANGKGAVTFRIWRGPNANGLGATELTGGLKTGAELNKIVTSADKDSSLEVELGEVTLSNEYLFVEAAWKITSKSGSETADCIFRWGEAGTRIISTNFTAPSTIEGQATVEGSGTVAAAGKDLTSRTGASVTGTGTVAASGHKVSIYEKELLNRIEPDWYWRLDEAVGSGIAYDSTNNNRDGEVGAGITFGEPGSLFGDTDTAIAISGASNVSKVRLQSYTVGNKGSVGGRAKRTSTGNTAFFGSNSGFTSFFLRVNEGTNDITFAVTNEGPLTWTNAWPGNNVWVSWTIKWDTEADTAELVINGVSQGVKELTANLNSPGYFKLGVSATEPFEAWPWIGLQDEAWAASTLPSNADLLAIHNLAIASTTASTAGSGAVTATGQVVKTSQASVSGTGTLTGAGEQGSQKTGIAAVAGSGSVSGSGVRIVTAQASVSGSGTLSGSGTRATLGKALVSGTGALSGSGLVGVHGSAAVTGSGTIRGNSVRVAIAVAVLAGQGLINASGSPVGGHATVTISDASAINLSIRSKATAVALSDALATKSGLSDTGPGVALSDQGLAVTLGP